jgi:hypothetical protein
MELETSGILILQSKSTAGKWVKQIPEANMPVI